MGNAIQTKTENKPAVPPVGIFFISLSPGTQNETLRVIGKVSLIATYIRIRTTVCSIAQRPILIESRVGRVVVQRPPPSVVHPEPPPVPGVPIVLEALAVSTRVPWQTTKGII